MPRYAESHSQRRSSGEIGCLGIIVRLITSHGVILLVLSLVFAQATLGFYYGAGYWGPKRTLETTVISTHVDSGKESHYMVTTENGTFEVNNSFWMGVTNADEIYGSMKPGDRIRITTQGNKVVGYFIQEYPYILRSEKIPQKK